MAPVLTIAIPTYNRPDKIHFLLGSIASQYKSDMPLEVFVCDNSSSSKTRSIVHSYSDHLPVRYIQHERNIGGILNFLFAVENAAGKYCWLVGDDDLILPNALQKIISVLLLNNRITGIVCGYTYVSEENRHSASADIISCPATNVFMNTSLDAIIDKWEDSFMYAHLPSLHTSILSMVFDRQLWLDAQHAHQLSDIQEHNPLEVATVFDSLFTTFPHSVIWGYMFIGKPVYMLSRPLAAIIYGAQDWLSHWPAIMYTRNLELSDLYIKLGAAKPVMHYYKELILSDHRLKQLILSNPSAKAIKFSFTKLIISNLESPALQRQLLSFARDQDIPYSFRLRLASLLFRPKIFKFAASRVAAILQKHILHIFKLMQLFKARIR